MAALAPDFLKAINLDETIADRDRCRTELAALRGAMRTTTDAATLEKWGWRAAALERWIVIYNDRISLLEAAS